MTIFGKRLSTYVEFTRPLLGLILVVGIARLVLSLGGAPISTARWFSMSAVMWIGLLYYSVRVHTSGFGSYKELLGVLAIPNVLAQTIAIVAIVISIVTGSPNIFSAPEYSFGGEGSPWLHVAAHVFIGTTIGSLAYWLFGSLIMSVAKKVWAGTSNTRGAVRA